VIRDRLPPRVTVYEVGPRDGLQNEARLVPTADKIALVNALVRTGLAAVEITSFVHPRWVPQLADAVEVARGVDRVPGVTLSALVPNRVGFEAARGAGMGEIAVFLSASETHNRKNVNRSVAESLAGFREVIEPATAAGMRVRAYVSTVYGCPYEGAIDPRRVVRLTADLLDLGVYQVSLGDTIGVANPAQVEEVIGLVLAEVPAPRVAMHFHDTRGTALANCLVGLLLGITTVDAAVGGLGGCPYAPGASGNLASEDVVAMLHAMGVETGVDLDALCACAQRVAALVGHPLPSKYLKAHLGAGGRVARAESATSTETDHG
jgi:hydroxymethylglutaryl-CoA lyase